MVGNITLYQDKKYDIRFDASRIEWACDCPAFMYRRKFKKKYCKHIIEIQSKKLEQGQIAEAVLVPEWSNGVDCKSIVRRFKSDPALKI